MNKQSFSVNKQRLVNNKDWQLPDFDIYEFRPKKTKYCACIPVLNEGEKIKKQLERMLPNSKLADILILDWGSTDGSLKKGFLKNYNVRTLLTKKSPGRQGTQLRMGFAYALRQGYEGIIQVDGNNKDGVEVIPEFIKALNEGYDYIQGSRFIKGGQAINTPFSRWFGVKLIASPILSSSAGYKYTDVTNGFRGYSRRYLLHPDAQIFRDIFIRYEFNLYLTVRAAQLGLKTKELPVKREYPKGKTPTKITILRGNLDFLVTIFKVAFKFYHPKMVKKSKKI